MSTKGHRIPVRSASAAAVFSWWIVWDEVLLIFPDYQRVILAELPMLPSQPGRMVEHIFEKMRRDVMRRSLQ
jgi:hypothetical protein